MTALAQILAARSGRERWLLAALFGAALPLALWLGILAPLTAARADAAASLRDARALHAFVADHAAGMPRVAAMAPLGAAGLEAGLRDAGLMQAVVALDAVPDGSITLRMRGVRFTDAAGWIDAQRAGWGYRIAAMRLDATPVQGRVDLRLSLEPLK